MNNFQDVLSGKFRPQVTALAMPDVESFIQKNAGYSVPLPPMQGADWIGGSVTDYSHNKMAQVIYKMGEQYIYICTFPEGSSRSRKTSFPPNCADALTNNTWFWGMDANGDTQAAWNHDGCVCVATSNLEKKDLIAYLDAPEGNSQNAPR